METRARVLMIVLDGFGLSDRAEGNAIRLAAPEFLTKLFRDRPLARLDAAGPAVGLPPGQMGNSEVGHLNIGTGRVVPQDITRIDTAIADGTLAASPVLEAFLRRVRASGRSLHLMGLLSDGGVHSHQQHLHTLIAAAAAHGLANVFIHAFTDGRDCSPTAGVHAVSELVKFCQAVGVGRVSTLSGRYFAMDRDQRWERVEKAYQAMVFGVGNRSGDPVTAMEAAYRANITDEFIQPVVIESDGGPVGLIEPGDGVLAFNFRGDRLRQLTQAFVAPEFTSFKRKDLSLDFVSMTRYAEAFSSVPVIMPPLALPTVLGELLAEHDLLQFRIAETEKFSHVTSFVNGGREAPFPGEDRLLIPSPRVKTYDLKPELAAFEIGDALIERIQSRRYPFLLANLANCDLVGHTGVLDAAVKAVTTVDCVVSKVVPVAFECGYDCIVTADHGNVEHMIDAQTGEGSPENTLNPVPFCLLSRDVRDLRPVGRLADVAPTVLDLMGLEAPSVMTGTSLLIRKK
jgi:2,3-bisphosphoglycerate-independent phosphoglycerate mutase